MTPEALTSAAPMNYLRTFGPRADPATALTWGLIWLSLAVCAIVATLVVAGVVLRARPRPISAAAAPIEQQGGGLAWIYIGLALTVAALAVALVWTMSVVAAIASPPRSPALTIEVTGHQWWWDVRYAGGPGQTFVTANEIHIPVGQPVLVKLFGADVIHSFWIPALSGKTDTIPGRTNLAWLQADRPGVYRGQCAEFCGLQHANMGIRVSADTPAAFEAWRQAQIQPALDVTAPDAVAGRAVVVAHCGACHTIQGTDAGGVRGPDLTHLMSRATIAAGAAPNNPDALSGWIANPQSIKPGALMPATYLSGAELAQARAYLETLK